MMKFGRRPRQVSIARRVRRGLAREHGLTAIEYALIGALIFVVIVVAVKTIGTETSKPYQAIAAEMGQ
jgi:pilus assembly protein Flp/PilA